VTLKVAKLDEFRARLNSVAADCITVGEMVPRVHMDAELLLDELDPELLESLALLEPYGQSNPSPLFMTRGAEVMDVRAVGREEQHLKLFVSQGDRPVDCIGFGMGHNTEWLSRGTQVDLCHTPEINEFNGTRGIQLRLEDIRPASA
jgi:single-stranded-DNA-specific exonuclease